MSCLAAGCAAAQAHDSAVSVSFVEPDRFADIGERGLEREHNLKALATALERVAAPLLAPGQRLHLDVLDVDLAGTVRLTLPRRNVRIVTGHADWPSMILRYSLAESDGAVAGGEDRLFDTSFLNHFFSATERDDPLRYEKRMFKDWFQSRFGAAETVDQR